MSKTNTNKPKTIKDLLQEGYTIKRGIWAIDKSGNQIELTEAQKIEYSKI